MASEFTNLASTSKSSDKNHKKRGGGSGRLRLLPIAGSSANAYEPGNNGVTGNNGKKSLRFITHKKELAEAVRKMNSPLVIPGRESVGKPNKRRDSNEKSEKDDPTSRNAENSNERDIENLEVSVHASARKFNEHKLMADRRQREINILLDEIRGLQLETETLNQIHSQSTPVSKQSSTIKQEIAACTAEVEEQMHQRRQYEHMIRRLQTTQLRVDQHLHSMGTTVENSKKELEDVQVLCRELDAAKSRAVQFLQDVQTQLQIDRRTRARELGNQDIRAKNAQSMEQWRLQRVQERADMAAQLRGDLSEEEEAQLIRKIANRERAKDELYDANRAKTKKMADYDEVVAELKVVMGVSELPEIAAKIQDQASTSATLEKEKSKSEIQLIATRQEKEQAVQALNEIKASGKGPTELTREAYNTLENDVQVAKATLKINKGAYERLDSVLTSVRQGASGLLQRLQLFDDALEISAGDILERMEACRTPSSSVSTSRPDTGKSGQDLSLNKASGKTDALALAEVKLVKMLELIGQQSGSSGAFGGFGGDMEVSGDDTGGNKFGKLDMEDETWSPMVNNDPAVHENNIRVRPGTVHGFVVADLLPKGDDEEIASARSNISSASEASDIIDVQVPTRNILKMSSSRLTAEVSRKSEMDEKQKIATERGLSNEELLVKRKKKAQEDSANRLATSPIKGAILPGATDASKNKDLDFIAQVKFKDL